jgi:hypothetical protein
LVFDEADDYERSEVDGEETQLEIAQHDLWDNGMPLLAVAVTATMLPLFTNARYEFVKGADLFVTLANDYIGLLQAETFRDQGDKMVCIPTGAVTVKTNYLCEELWLFYKQAAQTKKALLLDVVSPRVWAVGNNRERAMRIREELKEVCLVVITGSEIYVLKPAKHDFEPSKRLRDITIGKVLEEVRLSCQLQ